MFGGIYTPIYKTRNRCVLGTLAWSAWISSCSRTAESLWCGWADCYDIHTNFNVVSWTFPLGDSEPALCCGAEKPFLASPQPLLLVLSGEQWWRKQDLCSIRALQRCWVTAQEKQFSWKIKNSSSSFLHPPEHLKGLWFFRKAQLCQQSGSYDWGVTCYTKLIASWHCWSDGLQCPLTWKGS